MTDDNDDTPPMGIVIPMNPPEPEPEPVRYISYAEADAADITAFWAERERQRRESANVCGIWMALLFGGFVLLVGGVYMGVAMGAMAYAFGWVGEWVLFGPSRGGIAGHIHESNHRQQRGW